MTTVSNILSHSSLLAMSIILILASSVHLWTVSSRINYENESKEKFNSAASVLAKIPSTESRTIVDSQILDEMPDEVSIINSSVQGVVDPELATTIAKEQLGELISPSTTFVDYSNNYAPVMSEEQAESEIKTQMIAQGNSLQEAEETISNLREFGDMISTQLDNQVTSSISIPESINMPINLGQSEIIIESENTSESYSITDTSVIYPNTDVDTDTVVKVIDEFTIESFHIIRSIDSPNEFEYKLSNIPPDAIFHQVDEQKIEVIIEDQYGEEHVLLTIAAPWAKDAVGNSVPISLKLINNRVMLHVEHSDKFIYPIVADPWARWSWVGYLWWGDNWTIEHIGYLVAVLGVWGAAAALAGIITAPVAGLIGIALSYIAAVGGWCKGRNGATFYFWTTFTFGPAWCKGW